MTEYSYQNPVVLKELDRYLGEVPHALGVLIVSADGISRYERGFTGPVPPQRTGEDHDKVREEMRLHRAALVGSLAHQAAHLSSMDGLGRMLRTVIDVEDGYCVIGALGQNCRVALYATNRAELSQLGYAVAELHRTLGHLLDVDLCPAGPAKAT